MIASPRLALQREFVSDRDRELYAAATEVLAMSKYNALRQLSCRVQAGVVEISGTVATFYLKQLAQAAMLQLQPAGRVRNLVEVKGETSVMVATNCARRPPPRPKSLAKQIGNTAVGQPPAAVCFVC